MKTEWHVERRTRIPAPAEDVWVLPYDYDYLTIVELEPGRRFREESTMLGIRRWVHDRTVESVGDQDTLVNDRITLAPRLPIRFLGLGIHRVVGA